MIVRYRRHLLLRVVETWFEPPAGAAGADVLECHQLSAALPDAVCTPFDTLVVRLEEPEEALFERIKKDTRREIRRAEDRDGASHGFAATEASAIDTFCEFYDRFARARQLAPAQRTRLRLAAAQDALALTYSGPAGAAPIVWHAYLLGHGRARLLYSATAGDDGQTAGRVNRYHHWRDILEFRRRGLTLYDFGGWRGDPSDAAHAGIDRFKEEFGGTPLRETNCTAGVSALGRLYLARQRK